MIREWVRDTAILLVVFSGVNMAITWLGVVLVPPAEAQGVLRPIDAIPLKVILLLLLGTSIGATACLAARQLKPSFAASGAILTLFLDLDHLPSLFLIPQPIRPAHSIIFLATTLPLVFLSTRKASLTLLTAATFFAHLGADKPFFPLLSPLLFDLTTFGIEVSFILVFLAYLLALGAGMLERWQFPPSHGI